VTVILRCLGNISTWQKLALSGSIVFQIKHTFQKQTQLSQYDIMGANGPLKLSVPTVKASRKGLYSEVLIDSSSDWQLEHWKSISSAYLKSPFFQYYDYKLEILYKDRFKSLLDFNCAAFEVVSKCLKLDKEYKLDSKTDIYYKDFLQSHETYPQVFDHKHAFQQNLSILDLIFNLGPEALDFLKAQ